MELFNDGFIWRYFHIWFGIIWIGTLYYFNFMQTPFFAETDAPTKTQAQAKLLKRAMAWFRWGAMLTFITGMILLNVRWIRTGEDMHAVWGAGGGYTMMLGAVFGITMFLNVWLIIWPAQKVVIASAESVLGGGKADPNAAARGARAGIASRTNTLFSIPLVLFMTMGSHYPLQVDTNHSLYWVFTGIIYLSWAAIQANAIWGKMVKPLATVKSVVHFGFLYTILLLALVRYMSIM